MSSFRRFVFFALVILLTHSSDAAIAKRLEKCQNLLALEERGLSLSFWNEFQSLFEQYRDNPDASQRYRYSGFENYRFLARFDAKWEMGDGEAKLRWQTPEQIEKVATDITDDAFTFPTEKNQVFLNSFVRFAHEKFRRFNQPAYAKYRREAENGEGVYTSVLLLRYPGDQRVDWHQDWEQPLLGLVAVRVPDRMIDGYLQLARLGEGVVSRSRPDMIRMEERDILLLNDELMEHRIAVSFEDQTKYRDIVIFAIWRPE